MAIDLENLEVAYKYVKTMTIEKRTAAHLMNRWETVHIYQFLENKHIEFHLSPQYKYNGTTYTQITLDIDLDRVHKRAGSTVRQEVKDIKTILRRLSSIPIVIEFTGNGYRVVSLIAWKDLDLDKARHIAMANKEQFPSVDPVSSFRRMPIARVGTHDKYRLIVPVEKSDLNFEKYKAMSKKSPKTFGDKDYWLKLFRKHWIPESFKSSGGMNAIYRMYDIKNK